MNIAVDLHMHSCLSPCGDELMTPNNIVNMAKLKGLDAIAVCDHNTARHLPAIAAVAREVDLTLLPGMELTTAEEVHLLAYFRDVDAALEFSDYIYQYLPPIPNRPEFFGEQLQLDDEDEPVATEPRLLLTALELGLDELVAGINRAGGLAVPAHINRGANGLLVNLGMLPAETALCRARSQQRRERAQVRAGRIQAPLLVRRALSGEHRRARILLKRARSDARGAVRLPVRLPRARMGR